MYRTRDFNLLSNTKSQHKEKIILGQSHKHVTLDLQYQFGSSYTNTTAFLPIPGRTHFTSKPHTYRSYLSQPFLTQEQNHVKEVKCSAAFSIVPDQPEAHTTTSATKIRTRHFSVFVSRANQDRHFSDHFEFHP